MVVMIVLILIGRPSCCDYSGEMLPCHLFMMSMFLSLKAKFSAGEASATGVMSADVQNISQQHPQEASSALAYRFRVHTSDPCRVCIGRCILRYLKVVASSLIPKSVILRLVLFRCTHPNTESIKTITEATRENIRDPTWKSYTNLL